MIKKVIIAGLFIVSLTGCPVESYEDCMSYFRKKYPNVHERHYRGQCEFYRGK